METQTPLHRAKLAIVGMASWWGACESLDAFDRSIYDATPAFTPVPPAAGMAPETGLNQGQIPWDANLNPQARLDLHPNFAIAAPPPESLQAQLLLEVAHRAVQDGHLPSGAPVAVVITAADSKAIAPQIARQWQFSGPVHSLQPTETSVFQALAMAQTLLLAGDVTAVLLGAGDLRGYGQPTPEPEAASPRPSGVPTLSYDQQAQGWIPGEGAGAVVLQLQTEAQRQQKRIYGVIDALCLCDPPPAANGNPTASPSPEQVAQTCQRAFDLAGVTPAAIQYLELSASGLPQEDAAEIIGLAQIYQSAGAEPTCAIGSARTTTGYPGGAVGMDSLIKTALCLYHRYLPATPHWSQPQPYLQEGKSIWQQTPFYVPADSRPWIVPNGATGRRAGLSSFSPTGVYAHLLLSEPNQMERPSRYLEQTPYFLLAIAADSLSQLQQQLQSLQSRIESCTSLPQVAWETWGQLQQRPQAEYALTILGQSREELWQQMEWAHPGLRAAFDQAGEWQTPVGSYFTAKPLGQQGQVAYVYPGAYSAYPGLARKTFRLFPQVWNHPLIQGAYAQAAMVEKLLYPKSLKALSRRQLEAIEQQLLDSPLNMLEAEIGFAGLMTTILKDYFQLRPTAVLGYSLGEISMMYAQEVWKDFEEKIGGLRTSPLFSHRIAGPKAAVREFWQLAPVSSEDQADFWSTYVLLADAAQIQTRLQAEPRIFLTQINAPQEVVIAGDPQACRQLIADLGCNAFRAPFNHAIHCAAIASEYPELVRLNTLKAQAMPSPVFYSAAQYAPIPLESQAIAHSLAQTLTQPLDFPRLIQQVYRDGARIFLEVGAGSHCCRWIDEILKQQPHLALPLNRRGMDEHTTILKALAKLVSHRVPLDLSPLYATPTPPRAIALPPNRSGPSHSSQFAHTSTQLTQANLALLQARQASLTQINQLVQLQLHYSRQVLQPSHRPVPPDLAP